MPEHTISAAVEQTSDGEVELYAATPPRPTTVSDTALYRIKLASFACHDDDASADEAFIGSVRLLGVSTPFNTDAAVIDSIDATQGAVIGHICKIDNVWRVTNPFHVVCSLPRTPIRLRVVGPSIGTTYGLTLSLSEP